MLREMAAADLAAVHLLNEGAVPAVGAATAEHLAGLASMADQAIVAEVDDQVVGFVLVLGPGCDYQSPNYRFFAERHDDFAYVDRIAIAPSAQRLGLGRAMYRAVIAECRAPVLCAEVNLRPPNPSSMQFHVGLGFRDVGEQEAYGGRVRVRLLELDLADGPG